MRSSALFVALSCTSVAAAIAALYLCKKKKRNDWEDPKVVHINRLPMTTELKIHTSVTDALASLKQKPLKSPFVQSLNGQWKFKFVIGHFAAEAIDFSTFHEWDTSIAVPGTWQTQGFGTAIYTNIKYPFDVNPPFVPDADNEIGTYVRSFDMEFDSKARNVFLKFGGVDSCFYVWLNEEFIGYSTDSRLSATFDVTNVVLPRDNVVVVRVFRWSCGSYLEDQDMWWLSGIFREVSLYSTPSDFSITDYNWACNVQDYLSGATPNVATVTVSVTTNAALSDESHYIEVLLFDNQDQLICSKILKTNYECTLEIQNPKLWSAEDPNVYYLVIKSSTDQVESCVVGLRSVEIRNNSILINNKAVLFYGVNHHEFSSHSGRTVTTEFLEQELLLMKAFNFNAIRCSHYPQHPALYDLATKYGFYVIDEANIETHGFAPTEEKLALDSNWKESYVARVKRMVLRDRNHASIVSWSLGNEAGYAPDLHDELAEWLRVFDPSRFVHYEPSSEISNATDIVCPMYARIDDIIAMKRIEKPLVLCEYSHAMGNSNGNLDQYWEAIRSHKHLQGGFIWDWQDQGLDLLTQDGIPYWGYGGDTGTSETPHDGCFNINGLVLPDLTPHPAMYECKKVFQPITFKIESQSLCIINRQYFCDTSAFRFFIQVLDQGMEVDSQEILLENPIAPLESKNVDLSLVIGTTYYVSAVLKNDTSYANAGHVVAFNDFMLDTTSDSIKESKALSSSMRGLSVREGGLGIVYVSGSMFEAAFDQNKGGLVSFSFGNKELLVSPFVPQFHRAMTDNDRGGCRGAYYELWTKFGLDKECTMEDTYMTWTTASSALAATIECRFKLVPKNISSTMKVEGNNNPDDEIQDPSDMVVTTNRILDTLLEFQSDDTVTMLEFPTTLGKFRRGLVHSYAAALNLESVEAIGKKSQKPFVCVKKTSTNTSTQKIFFDCSLVFTITASGGLSTSIKIKPSSSCMPCLPRVGMALHLDPSYKSVSWYGAGPHENYPDRKSGARLAIHNASVKEMFFPYIRPSENGNRCDTRWVELKSKDSFPTIRFSSATENFNFSALPYSVKDLEEANHVNELPTENDVAATFVNIDHRIMGVGGDDSWTPSVHKEFLIYPNQEFNFTIDMKVGF